MLRIQWHLSYTQLAQESTTRTYQCISEIYTLAYSPVNSGPVCKDACDLVHKVDEFVKAAPPYIENPNKYLPDGDTSGVCAKKRRKK